MIAVTEIDHGTYSGYQKHYQRGERPCDLCRMANRDYVNSWRRKKGGYGEQFVYRIGYLDAEGEAQYVANAASHIFTERAAVDEYISTITQLRADAIYWLEEAPQPRWMVGS